MKYTIDIRNEDLHWFLDHKGCCDDVTINRYDREQSQWVDRMSELGLILQLPYHGELICYHPSYKLTRLGRAVMDAFEAGLRDGSASTPAITLPDNVLIDPMPAPASPAEPEMWRWTNWERGGVLNGHRITVYFRVVDGVIQPDGPAERAFVPEFLKPWVGKSLAELQMWRRQTEVVGHHVGVLKRVGEF